MNTSKYFFKIPQITFINDVDNRIIILIKIKADLSILTICGSDDNVDIALGIIVIEAEIIACFIE